MWGGFDEFGPDFELVSSSSCPYTSHTSALRACVRPPLPWTASGNCQLCCMGGRAKLRIIVTRPRGGARTRSTLDALHSSLALPCSGRTQQRLWAPLLPRSNPIAPHHPLALPSLHLSPVPPLPPPPLPPLLPSGFRLVFRPPPPPPPHPRLPLVPPFPPCLLPLFILILLLLLVCVFSLLPPSYYAVDSCADFVKTSPSMVELLRTGSSLSRNGPKHGPVGPRHGRSEPDFGTLVAFSTTSIEQNKHLVLLLLPLLPLPPLPSVLLRAPPPLPSPPRPLLASSGSGARQSRRPPRPLRQRALRRLGRPDRLCPRPLRRLSGRAPRRPPPAVAGDIDGRGTIRIGPALGHPARRSEGARMRNGSSMARFCHCGAGSGHAGIGYRSFRGAGFGWWHRVEGAGQQR